MMIRPAVPADLPALEALFAQARAFMAAHGNPTQWAGGYPSADVLTADIRAGRSFVCTDETGALLASFCFAAAPDPAYEAEPAVWRSAAPYGVIHRIAVSAHGRGVASFCVDWCKARCSHLRADTHADNTVMQRFLAKQGFVRCGMIHPDYGERVAYEWTQTACPQKERLP